MSALIGKRIECHLEAAHGSKMPFLADVKPGRREGEIFLQPVEGNPPGGKGYVPIGSVFVRQILPTPPAEVPANVTPLPAAPTVAESLPSPGGEGQGEGGPQITSAEAPAPVEAPPQPELTDERRLSESPVSRETRRSRGRGGPVDHGHHAETPDAFQEKGK